MTVFEAILIALTFGILIVSLVGLVVEIVRNMKRQPTLSQRIVGYFQFSN